MAKRRPAGGRPDSCDGSSQLMSIEAMNAVFDHSATVGNVRMVMTLIANAANPQGWDSFQHQETIAAKAGHLGIRTVEKCIKTAVDLGELEVHRPDRTKGNRYSVMLPGLAINDDPAERDRRDEHYADLLLGRTEKTRRNRATRRSTDPSKSSVSGSDEDPSQLSGPGAEDPNIHAGPSAEDPNEHSGGTRTSIRVGPERTDGWDPNIHAGPLKEALNNVKQHETTEKETALTAEDLWNRYPHNRRDLNPQRTLDVVNGIGAAGDLEQLLAALEEDLQSEDWLSGFIPKFSNWLRDRKWDRPVTSVAQLPPLGHVPLGSEKLEQLLAALESAVGENAAGSISTYRPWYGQHGAQLIVAFEHRADWIERRYGRVLDTVAKSCGFAGVQVIAAANPTTKEEAA